MLLCVLTDDWWSDIILPFWRDVMLLCCLKQHLVFNPLVTLLINSRRIVGCRMREPIYGKKIWKSTADHLRIKLERVKTFADLYSSRKITRSRCWSPFFLLNIFKTVLFIHWTCSHWHLDGDMCVFSTVVTAQSKISWRYIWWLYCPGHGQIWSGQQLVCAVIFPT